MKLYLLYEKKRSKARKKNYNPEYVDKKDGLQVWTKWLEDGLDQQGTDKSLLDGSNTPISPTAFGGAAPTR